MTRVERLIVVASLTTVVLLTACGPKAPVVAPGQVVVSGDVTFRTLEGNAIEVSVMRSAGPKQATGTATFHGMTLADAQKSPLIAVARGRAWLVIVNELSVDPVAAYDVGNRAIEEVGTAYRRRHNGKALIDDTGNDLKLAEISKEKGDLERAASDVKKVLEHRLTMYLRVFKGDVE